MAVDESQATSRQALLILSNGLECGTPRLSNDGVLRRTLRRGSLEECKAAGRRIYEGAHVEWASCLRLRLEGVL